MFENISEDRQIIAEFIIESRENLEGLDAKILSLEDDPQNKEILNHVFRAVHTIKGGSGFLSLDEITDLSHRLENILDGLRKEVLRLTPEILDVILEGIDILTKLFDILERELESPGSARDVSFDLKPIILKIDKIRAATEPSVPEEIKRKDDETIALKEEMVIETDEDKLLQKIIEENKATFIEETNEYISVIDNDLIRLEKEKGDTELINKIFRSIHTIKGNAAYLGFKNLEKLTHAFENILDALRKGRLKVTDDIFRLLFNAFDGLKEIYNAIVATGKDLGADKGLIIAEIGAVLANSGDQQASMSIIEKGIPEPASSNITNAVDQETINIFLRNAEIHLRAINNCINELNKGDTTHKTIDNLLRNIHNLDKAARFVSFTGLNRLLKAELTLLDMIKDNVTSDIISLLSNCHKSALQLINAMKTNSEIKLDETLIADLNKRCDEIEAQNKRGKKEADASQDINHVKPEAGKKGWDGVERRKAQKDVEVEKRSAKIEQTIRVEHSKLDRLMNLIGELIISKNYLEMLSERIESGAGYYNISEIAKELKQASIAVGKISEDLQTTIMNVTMIPVGTVFNKFPRMVRDLSKANGKLVELRISGEETKLDKTIIEQIGDPLIHLIRNGVDHGIELPEDRRRANKPDTGIIELRAFQKADNVIIEIQDDGKGMDPVLIRNKAVEKGILSKEDAENLDNEGALNLIFEPGFSTAEKITDISGRGVGMDVVRNNIRRLGGHVSIHTEKGIGSRFTLTLPLTLAIIKAIMVRLGDNIYAIPLNAVVETIKVSHSQIKTLKKKKAINLRGEVIGIEDLRSLMNIPANREDDHKGLIPIVILLSESLLSESKKIGFIVDEFLRQQEIVIKPLVDFLAVIKGISGATILGDGKIVLILDPNEIVELATT